MRTGLTAILANVAILLQAVMAIPAFAASQSRVERHTIHSEVLGDDRSYSIFLPRGYDEDTTKRYPVLFLLHGMWETDPVWYERGHVKDVMDLLTANGEACDMIIVSPNAGGNIAEGIWNGYFDMPGWNYETFFFSEFLPHLENTYRLRDDRGSRAVAGLSMGGGGATKYGQHHPDKFCAVYAMSALMSIPAYNLKDSDKEDKLGILTRSVIENSCVDFLNNADEATKDKLRSLAWYVDCGDDDFLLDRNIEFYQAMRKAGVPCEFRVRDGGHVWEYWHSALYDCLPFVSRQFRKYNQNI